jgi:hypothetical protein
MRICSRHLSASLGLADIEWVISEWSRPYSRCDAMERVCAVALRYLVLNVLMGLDTPSFTPVALVDSTV